MREYFFMIIKFIIGCTIVISIGWGINWRKTKFDRFVSKCTVINSMCLGTLVDKQYDKKTGITVVTIEDLTAVDWNKTKSVNVYSSYEEWNKHRHNKQSKEWVVGRVLGEVGQECHWIRINCHMKFNINGEIEDRIFECGGYCNELEDFPVMTIQTSEQFMHWYKRHN